MRLYWKNFAIRYKTIKFILIMKIYLEFGNGIPLAFLLKCQEKVKQYIWILVDQPPPTVSG